MIQTVDVLSNELHAARSQAPTFLEGTSVRITKQMAHVAVFAGSTKKAIERGKFLSESMKPILARQTEIKINMNHAKGVVRCNAYIDREMQALEALEQQQHDTMIALGIEPKNVTSGNGD